MIAGQPPSAELESFLGTVPGMIYRTRLVPPYDSEFIRAELGSVVGYPVGDSVGPHPKRRWPDLIHPEDRERVGTAMLGAPADGSVIEVEYRVRRADGSHAWILSRARRLLASDGTPYLHGAAIDVTARHEAAALGAAGVEPVGRVVRWHEGRRARARGAKRGTVGRLGVGGIAGDAASVALPHARGRAARAA